MLVTTWHRFGASGAFASFSPVAFVCALTACTGSASPNLAPTCPTPIPGSGALAVPAQLLYPAPGASNVADGSFTMVTAYATSLTLSAGTQTIALPTPGAAPSPMPSPTATPYFQGQLLQGEAVPSLQSHTTYTVLDQRGGAGQCNPPTTLGAFTTE